MYWRPTLIYCLLGVMAGASGGCAPGAIKSIQLYPDPSCAFETGARFAALDAAQEKKVADLYSLTLTAGGDSLRIFVRLEEFPNYIEASVEMTNATTTNFPLSSDMFALLDGSRLAFAQVGADEVANEMLGMISEVPEYQPKYNYRIQSSTYGTATTNYYGAQAQTTYSGRTTSRVTAEEDPYHALGYSIGAIFAEAANDKVRACARRIYETGISRSTELVARSRGAFTVYWRNRDDKPYPLRFLVKDTNIELLYVAPSD